MMEQLSLFLRVVAATIGLGALSAALAFLLAQLAGWRKGRAPSTSKPKRVVTRFATEWRDELPRADRRTRVQR